MNEFTRLYVILALITIGVVILFWMYSRKLIQEHAPDEGLDLQGLRTYLEGQIMAQGRRIDALQNENTAMRGELAKLRAENEQLRTTNEYLMAQIGKRRSTAARGDTGLRELIVERMSEDELRTLCFDMGIEWPGQAGETLTARVVTLLAWCTRHGRLDDLVARIKAARPDIEGL